MGECSVTSKLCLTFLCLVFWVAGAGLFYIGIEIFLTYNDMGQLASATYTLIPASIMIAVGVFMFILGLIGLIGGCKENTCLLAVFFTLLLVILVCEIAAGVLGFAYRQLVEDALHKGMDKALWNYTDDETLRHEVDFVQENVKCCGVTNYTDWFATPWGDLHPDMVPLSCCVEKDCGLDPVPSGVDPHKHNVTQNGCLNELRDKFNTYLGTIAGVTFGFALVQVLGMICSCILLCRTRKDVPYSELHENDLRGGGIRA